MRSALSPGSGFEFSLPSSPSVSASASSSWAPDPFVSVRPVPSAAQVAGPRKLRGAVVPSYVAIASRALHGAPRRSDGAQFRPNPNARPERDETLTLSARPRRRTIPDACETCPPSDRARVRAPGRDRRDERLDETRRVRANATPRADDVPVARPGPSSGSCARFPVRAVGVLRPAERHSLILVRRGRSLLPAPRCGWA